MAWVDAQQMARHGLGAPRCAARIWVDPRACHDVVVGGLDVGRRRSGRVVGGDWAVAQISRIEKLRMAEEHWGHGLSWEEVGAYEYMRQRLAELGSRDGVRSMDDIVRRYAHLDEIFEVVRREGRLRSRSELPGPSHRETNGVYMHIGRDGSPVFGNGGCHRLAMARVLELRLIPAQLGMVHPDALSTWRALRSPDHG
ncbi:MAG: hypothetical protein ABL966_10380 [Acidimicrobiales bacterium]